MPSAHSLLRRVLHAPATHFAAVGAALFLAQGVLDARSVPDAAVTVSREIVIDAVRIRGLRRNYALANNVKPTEEDARALAESAVIEEILYREAIARGLEQGDRAIGWRLVQKMRFLGEDNGEDVTTLYHRALDLGLHRSDPVVRRILTEKLRIMVGRAAPSPSDAQLAAWYEANSAKYAQASRVTLRHAFFDRTRRGDDAARGAAEEEAASLAADPTRKPAGDPFVMGPRLAGQGAKDLVKFFGPAFAERALVTPVGQWQGPVQSAFGWHVIFIEKRFDERVPELAEVRSQAEKAYEAEQREARVVRFIEQMRPAYTVRIDEVALTEENDG
jgi:peptidyl-prolyl cis-trans isomerase C